MAKGMLCKGRWNHVWWVNRQGRQECDVCHKLNPVGVPAYIRFWDRVDKNAADGHWLWTGNCPKNGYGIYTLGKPPDHYTVTVHRYAWVILRGPIPMHMDVDHVCRVRNCVNPDHLEPKLHIDNMAARPNAGKCKKGHELVEPNLTRTGRCKACYGMRFSSAQVTA